MHSGRPNAGNPGNRPGPRSSFTLALVIGLPALISQRLRGEDHVAGPEIRMHEPRVPLCRPAGEQSGMQGLDDRQVA